jgi:hypothetical protein
LCKVVRFYFSKQKYFSILANVILKQIATIQKSARYLSGQFSITKSLYLCRLKFFGGN